MNTLAKLIAAIAALIASIAFAWVAKDGVTVHHEGDIDTGVPNKIELTGSAYPVRVEHELKGSAAYPVRVDQFHMNR